jgi:EmrB/QacA subfamily drug resistance transporter
LAIKETAVEKPQPSENRSLVLALSGIIMSILLVALDQTIVNPAMPRIVEELQGFSLFAWVSTAYLLTSTATIPIAGKLGDMFGRKTLLLIAVFVFVGFSALSGAAPSMVWLVVFRAFQGIGAGMLQSNAFAMIAELFPDPAKRARWQGFIAAAFGFSSLLGPAMGGFITDNLDWRWVFYVNVPVGVVAVLALIFNLPKSTPSGGRKVDWLGSFFMTGSVVSLLLALTWGGHTEPNGYAWNSPQILGLFGIALVMLLVFLYVETRAAEPILPLKLFTNKAVSVIAVVSFTTGATMLGATLFIPLFIQVVKGQSASSSGALTTPLALAMVTANILTGQFIGRVGLLKLPFITGSITALVGMLLMLTIDTNTSLLAVTIYMMLMGFGLGQVMPSMTIVVQESISRRDLGVGISSVQFFRSIGSTMGVAIIGTIVTNSYASAIATAPAAAGLPSKLLETISEPQNLLNAKVAASLPESLIETVRTLLTAAIHSGLLVSTGVAVVVLLASLFVPAIRIKSGGKKRKSAEPAVAEKELVA